MVPGSLADLQINVAGPSSANEGDTLTYVVTMENNSLPDADGATFNNSVPAGFVDVTAACTASGGATCLVTLAITNTTVSGTLGAFPHLGKVTVTITGRASTSGSSATDTATIQPPAGVSDPDLSTNTSTISTAIATTVQLHAAKSVDLTQIGWVMSRPTL